jgi:flavin-dependent dehydrogenase
LCFDFAQGFSPTDETINIERAAFDDMLLEQARLASVDVRQLVAATRIISLADGDVRVACDTGEIRARWLIDASGQGTLVGRHLGTRKTADEPHLRKAAYFNHFTGVRRAAGRRGGHPLIVMVDEGWFWMIPLDERRTSIGLVMDADISRRVQRASGLTADRMLRWGIERCPAVAERMIEAAGPQTNHVAADFSYRCRPYAGPGYFLVGDAAAFMDPIFSTGVCVAMTGSAAAAKGVLALLDDGASAARCRAAHIKLLESSTRTLFTIIRQYYDHSFRELFLNGTGPLEMHRAVIGVLAGNVFPAPWRLRWRMALFNLCVAVNRRLPLVTRRDRHSLLAYPMLPVKT